MSAKHRIPNEHGGVGAGRALCLHMLRCWPGATHRGCSPYVMEVSVTIVLSVAPETKHVAQMRGAAGSLKDDPKSIQVN